MTKDVFEPVLGTGNDCDPKDIFIGATCDQGCNFINALEQKCGRLGVGHQRVCKLLQERGRAQAHKQGSGHGRPLQPFDCQQRCLQGCAERHGGARENPGTCSPQ